jgi:hypothetical protein
MHLIILLLNRKIVDKNKGVIGTMEQKNYDNRLLSRQEAAVILGVKENTLAVWKSSKAYDLPVVKIGRLARYRYADLLDFIERRTVNGPISQEGKCRWRGK